jgi:serine protein kinase
MADEDFSLEELREKSIEDYARNHWEGSFEAFLKEKVAPHPVRHIRTAFQYLRDMIDHFGWDEREDAGETFRKYRIFDDPFHAGKKAVFGLERTVRKLVNYVRAASHEEGKERIFVLTGPVGTAKTTLVDLLARGLEEYSRTEEGAAYTVTWLFPRQIDDEGGKLGFVRTGPDTGEVYARVRCQLHDNPLLLIPRAQRRAYLGDLLRRAGFSEADRPVVPRKILEGELCFNCTQIYNYLLGRFKGDWRKVIERAQVERITFSELSGRGIAKILPEGNVETSSSIISFDENYKALSQLLSDINLVKFNGKYVAANRGIVHYSDIFKKPVVYLQHLLSACEEHRIDFGEVGADIDVVIVGTSNLPEYEAFRKNPLSHGIRSRMRKIEVPYLLNYTDEMKIYEQGLREVARTRHIAPHTTELAALWAVLTRLIKCRLYQTEEGLEAPEKEVLEKLAPLQKALLYAGEVPRDFSREARRTLTKELLKKLRYEFPDEGMSGISPRVIQNLFADICERKRYRCLNPFEFFAEMRDALEAGSEMYEFISSEGTEEFGNVIHHLESVNELYNRVVKEEIETAVIDVNDEEIRSKIQDYLNNVKAFLRKETVPAKSGKGEAAPNEELMQYIEDILGVEEKEREEFRFKTLSRASGAAQTGKPLDIRETYADVFRAVRAGLFQEKKGSVNWDTILSALEKMDDAGEFARTPEWTRSLVRTLADNMKDMFGYCPSCTRDVVAYAVNKHLLG